jgi:hypothetical protein
MLPSSEVISTNSKRCCRTNNSTTNYLFFQEFRHKKNKNLTNHINNAWDLSMFDDYKRLTDVLNISVDSTLGSKLANLVICG